MQYIKFEVILKLRNKMKIFLNVKKYEKELITKNILNSMKKIKIKKFKIE